MSTIELHPQPLTRDAFAKFGDVIEVAGADCVAINQGTTQRFHDLARVEMHGEGARPLINIFRSTPRALPMDVLLMERHPLGSQAFIPLSEHAYLVLVAPPSPALDPARLQAFVANASQGVNYAAGVWHHPLLAMQTVSDFLVVDRGGPGQNLDEVTFACGTAILHAPE